MSEEAAKEQKQVYLRKQILDEGFDAEEFVDYLNHELHVGAELDLISFNQLVDVVQGFKNKKKGELLKSKESIHKSNIHDRPLIQNLELITSPEQKNTKPKTIIFQKYGNIQEEEIDKTFKCLKFSPKMQVITNPKIQVSDPQRKTAGGIFGIGATSFLLFKINTYDYKWEVRRRYSDFQWLRGIICKFFPTYVVPPIPKKNAKKRTHRDLEKRMRILTYFLNDIALVPEIFQSKYVTGFMSISNDEQFDDLKRQANKKEAFQTITSLQTQSGTVTIKLSSERKAYMQQIDKFLSGAQTLYKSLTKDSKQLQNLFIDETNTLYRMGNQFADLHLLLRDFNNRLPNFKQPSLNDTYITLNNMMVEWGNIIRNQYSYMEKNFNTFFKFMRHEIYSIKELYQKVKNLEEEYFKNKGVLDKKKEKIFQMGDTAKWEIPKEELSSIPSHVLSNRLQATKIMLPKESFEMEKQRMRYAFYQSQFVEHSSELLHKGSAKYCDNFKEFAIKIKVNNQQLTELWTQIATNFADPRKKMIVQPIVQTMDKDVEYDD